MSGSKRRYGGELRTDDVAFDGAHYISKLDE